MSFAAIYIADFSVQAVIRAEPALTNAAVALVDGKAPTWNVTAANKGALDAGIEIGMARTLAEQCGTVEIRQRSRSLEKSAHAALLDLGWSFSPRVEDTAGDSIVIDLTGLGSVFGCDEQIAHQLAQHISAIGLSAQIAVSENLETALHAARGFAGITLIAGGEEAQRLGPLPVSVLGASPETLEILELWGVRSLNALAALPVPQLSERLGQEGVRLHEWARSAGVRSLVLAEPSALFEEELELDDSVEELEPLSFLLGRLLDQICARLAARSLAIQIIRLRFSLDPAERKDIQVRNDASRHKKSSNTYERTLTLPVPMRNSKMLLNLVRLKLQGDPPEEPILKIFVAAEPARPRAMQAGLFRPASPDPEKLELTIARLANLVGERNVGTPQLADTHRPDDFSMVRFAPEREDGKTAKKTAPKPESLRRALSQKAEDAQESRRHTLMGFRVFRPPLPADVQMRENQPQRVAFQGRRGEVTAASGPWRISGDWWREEIWDQDEWDLEIRFERDLYGLYRFYFDSLHRRWFVRGGYD